MSGLAIGNQVQTQPASQRAKRVTGKTKLALDLMVWEGLTDNEAAVKTGITVTNIRLMLKQPHVRAYYRHQIDVLRERESARNIHALVEVRDQKANQMARVQAVKALEQIDGGEQASRSANSLPGLQIVIVQGGSQSPMIDVTPTADVTHD